MNSLQKIFTWVATVATAVSLAATEPEQPKPLPETQKIEAIQIVKDIPNENTIQNYSIKSEPKIETKTQTKIIIPEKKYVEPQPIKTTTISQCNTNYSWCLKKNAGDYDCRGGSGNGPNYTGRVKVLWYDQFGLDRDKDGWGCE